MIAYGYNRNNGYYTGSEPCQLDPVRTQREGKACYLIPADATTTAPPVYDGEKQIPVWDGSVWKLEDYPPEAAEGPEEADRPHEPGLEEIINTILGVQV